MTSAPARSAKNSASIASAASLPSPHPHPDRTTATRLPMAFVYHDVATRASLPRRRREGALGDRGAGTARKVQVVLEVVNGRQAIIKQLLGVEEMRQIGAAVARAAGAGAPLL